VPVLEERTFCTARWSLLKSVARVLAADWFTLDGDCRLR
jgi:hypothetical protein